MTVRSATVLTVAPALGVSAAAAACGPSWVAVGILAAYAVGEAVLLAVAQRDVRRALDLASEAQASEGMTRAAAEVARRIRLAGS